MGIERKDPAQEEFAARVAELADGARSLAELARQIGASETAVRQWRAGASDPSRYYLIKLAATAGVSLEWLATGREQVEASPPTLPEVNPALLAVIITRVMAAWAKEQSMVPAHPTRGKEGELTRDFTSLAATVGLIYNQCVDKPDPVAAIQATTRDLMSARRLAYDLRPSSLEEEVHHQVESKPKVKRAVPAGKKKTRRRKRR